MTWKAVGEQLHFGLYYPAPVDKAKPTRSEGRTIAVTVSLGLAAWDGHVSPQELLRHADEAMYRAKAEGRNRAAL